jgi:phosphoglycolate phosphatase-like HAD superfamily hydrolase
MNVPNPSILALDFDGVLCDGLQEYFQTAWHTYCQMWSTPKSEPDPDLYSPFARLRPVIETGWEMPILIEALCQGIAEETILEQWGSIVPQIVTSQNLDPQKIAATLDGVRDRQIANHLSDWLALHRFYPGTIAKLQTLLCEPMATIGATIGATIQVFIITTKEGRFVDQLLQQAGVNFPRANIFGKETKRPKHQILRELLQQAQHQAQHPEPDRPCSIWFVEDRLATLKSVQGQSDLDQVCLFLADWGYNTPKQRLLAQQDPRVCLLSLNQLTQDWHHWY